MLVKNDLFDYKNRYIYQDSKLFKFSLDSILLAEFINIEKNDVLLDMATGNMAIPLILSTYKNNKIFGFEIQKEVYELGVKSIEVNGLQNRIEIINDDVNNLGKYFPSEYFSIMFCNPPYFKNCNINQTKGKSLARHEISLNLDNIFALARTYLKNKGKLYLVQRAERIDEIINLGIKYKINVKDIIFVSTKMDANPKIVLIKAVKNSKLGVKVHKELCIANLKTYQNIFREEK